MQNLRCACADWQHWLCRALQAKVKRKGAARAQGFPSLASRHIKPLQNPWKSHIRPAGEGQKVRWTICRTEFTLRKSMTQVRFQSRLWDSKAAKAPPSGPGWGLVWTRMTTISLIPSRSLHGQCLCRFRERSCWLCKIFLNDRNDRDCNWKAIQNLCSYSPRYLVFSTDAGLCSHLLVARASFILPLFQGEY